METGKREEMGNKKIKAKSETTQFPYVPEDIVIRILSKIPVNSLFKFKCVSKFWHSSISDPKFTLSTQREQLIVFSDWFRYKKISIHLVDYNGSVKELPIPKPFMDRKYYDNYAMPKIKGSCNGLLLLSARDDLFLWNPSTRCCSKLGLWHDRLISNDYCRVTTVTSGLCYDSSTDEYMAVMAIVDRRPSRDDYFYNSVMVGSFRNKTWSEIPFPYDKHTIVPGPTVNERLHWLAVDINGENPSSRSKLIVCFDPQMNELVNVAMPQGEEDDIIVLGLGVLNGCLSVVLYRGEACVEVLVMKKYGDESFWKSLFVISNILTGLSTSDSLVPLCYREKGRVLMAWNRHTILVYGTKRGKVWDFPISAGPYDPDVGMFVETRLCNRDTAIFVESLVSPTGYNWDGEEEV